MVVVLYSRAEDTWKIADFGLMSEGTSSAANLTTSARGTNGYRAPELLAENKRSYNNKVDIWSMGCILYELAVGIRAFSSDWRILHYSQSKEILEIPPGCLVDEHWRSILSNLMGCTLNIDPAQRIPASHLLRQSVFHYHLASTTGNTSFPTLSSLDTDQSHVTFELTAQNIYNNNIHAFASSPRTSCFAIGDHESENICLWNIERGLNQKTLHHEGHAFLSFLNASVEILASTGEDDVIFWDVETGMVVGQRQVGGFVKSMSSNHSGDRLALLIDSEDCLRLEIWGFLWQGSDLRSTLVRRAVSDSFPQVTVAYQGDDLYMYHQIWNSGARNTGVHLFQVSDSIAPNSQTRTIPEPSELLSFRQEIVLTFDWAGYEAWDASTARRLITGGINGEILCCTFTPCGEYVLISDSQNTVSIWSCAESRCGYSMRVNEPLRHIWFCQGERSTCMAVGRTSVMIINIEVLKYRIGR